MRAGLREHGTVLHVGLDWCEIRLDIDESVNPDVIGTMTNMQGVGDRSVDAVFSSHNIEHLYPHEVPVALAEFHRVLKPDGFALITCPDLQSVAALIAEDRLTEAAYVSPAGPITPLDIVYGHRASMALAICTWLTAVASPRRCWWARSRPLVSSRC